MEEESSNRRIAKNTVMLYIRMMLSIIVSLYTSRVVLQTLGVEDYGIYGLVGGVVGMFSFINGAMAGATSRFMSYEIGKTKIGEDGKIDLSRLRDTFSTALIIHFLIGLIILALSETVGLWFLCSKLVIPEGRMYAAHWVFQLSVVSMMLGVTQVPYNATIIAHERMDIYAYVELLNVFLKLGIVYLLVIGNFDKLILYAVLVLVVSVLIRFIYRIFCLHHYEESRFRWVWNSELMKPMLGFSGWNMYGSLSIIAKNQGISFVVNIFWGVALNAAVSVATTVQGAIKGLASNVTTAITPQVVKNYAKGDIRQMESLMQLSIKITAILMGLFVVPVMVSCDALMSLWLVNVPEYASLFCKILMVSGLFAMINSAVNNAVYASGRMKDVSFYTGTLTILTVPVLYVLFKFGFPPETTQYLGLVLNIVILFINLYFAKRIVPQLHIWELIRSILLTCTLIVVAGIPVFLLREMYSNRLIELVMSFVVNALVLLSCAYYLLINKEQRMIVNNFVRSKFK